MSDQPSLFVEDPDEPASVPPTTAGRSDRTPAKHALMDKIVGREVGAVNQGGNGLGRIWNLRWIDLTAGDGSPPPGHTWSKNCSPGILAYHGAWKRSRKPLQIDLYEVALRTFERLEEALHEHLPDLGYTFDGTSWTKGRTVLTSHNDDGRNASLDGIDNTTAVMVFNDPNAITTWAARDGFFTDVRERTDWFLSISTMGCNVGGTKRLPVERRHGWFDLVAEVESLLRPSHDLLLAKIVGDDAQWSYLVEAPDAWRARVQQELDRSFDAIGFSMESSWLRQMPDEYRSILNYLFLTPKERGTK